MARARKKKINDPCPVCGQESNFNQIETSFFTYNPHPERASDVTYVNHYCDHCGYIFQADLKKKTRFERVGVITLQRKVVPVPTDDREEEFAKAYFYRHAVIQEAKILVADFEGLSFVKRWCDPKIKLDYNQTAAFVDWLQDREGTYPVTLQVARETLKELEEAVNAI